MKYTPSADPFADTPGSVQPGPHADELRRQGGRVIHAGRAQREVRRHDQRDEAGGELHARPHRSDVELAVPRRGRRAGGRHGARHRQPVRTATVPNPDFVPDLVPYDLSRGGGRFHSTAATIKQQAVYVQDDIKAGNATSSWACASITTTG